MAEEPNKFLIPIQNGWMQGVRRVESPNFGPRPQAHEISLIVIHSISLPPQCFGGPHVDELFTNRLDENAHPYFKGLKGLEVSSHLFISRQGIITQYVSFEDRAWHAGRSSYKGRIECNDYSVGIELEGSDFCAYTVAQYQALRRCMASLRLAYPMIGNNVAGHCEIAPERKTDPGPHFDYTQVRV